MPKATPWKATLTTDESSSARKLLFLLELFPGVLHRGAERLELDIIQPEYLREVKKVNGQLANVELETLSKAEKDPWKELQKKK